MIALSFVVPGLGQVFEYILQFGLVSRAEAGKPGRYSETLATVVLPDPEYLCVN